MNETSREEFLLEVRPSWWNFFWYFVFGWLIIPLLVALWLRWSMILRVTERRVLLELGVLNKEYKEIFISDIRTIDVRQSFLQRIFGIGDIMIATAGTAGWEDIACGLPDPRGIMALLANQRKRLRGQPPDQVPPVRR